MHQLVINTQERAISADINRLQKFLATDFSELFRYWLDVTSNGDVNAGVIVEPNTIETPLRADILGGLMVRPVQGATDLLVDPGVIMVMAPDAAPDESNYKYVHDVGVTSTGVIQIAAGGGGATRIDVVEVQINSVALVVTATRDIFNTSTGLFTATTVTKETSKQLTYRVRQGTAGGGFPGTVNGWLPICVASVPNTSTTNDTVTFWDVRPLVTSRVREMANISYDWPVALRNDFLIDDKTSAGQMRLTGQFRSAFGAYEMGGKLLRGTPGTDNAWCDLQDAANLAAGFSYSGTGWAYAYLVTPFGLPRWARYTDGPSGRVPRSPLGIVVVSATAPNHRTGKASAAIALPTSTGLGGSDSSAILVTAFRVLSGTPGGLICDGKTVWFRQNLEIIVNGSGISASGGTFTLTEGTHYPANAKAIYAQIVFSPTLAANTVAQGSACSLAVRLPGTTQDTALIVMAAPCLANTGALVTLTGPQSEMVRIPIPNQYPSVAGSGMVLDWVLGLFEVHGGTAPTLSSASLTIVGYDL